MKGSCRQTTPRPNSGQSRRGLARVCIIPLNPPRMREGTPSQRSVSRARWYPRQDACDAVTRRAGTLWPSFRRRVDWLGRAHPKRIICLNFVNVPPSRGKARRIGKHHAILTCSRDQLPQFWQLRGERSVKEQADLLGLELTSPRLRASPRYGAAAAVNEGSSHPLDQPWANSILVTPPFATRLDGNGARLVELSRLPSKKGLDMAVSGGFC